MLLPSVSEREAPGLGGASWRLDFDRRTLGLRPPHPSSRRPTDTSARLDPPPNSSLTFWFLPGHVGDTFTQRAGGAGLEKKEKTIQENTHDGFFPTRAREPEAGGRQQSRGLGVLPPLGLFCTFILYLGCVALFSWRSKRITRSLVSALFSNPRRCPETGFSQ